MEISLSDYGYEYSTVNEAVPRNYGKIPSKKELYNLILDYYNKHEFDMEINKSEIKNKDYLIRLTNYLIEYYGEDSIFEMEYSYSGGVGKYFHGVIKVDEEFINIPLETTEVNIKR